MDDAADNICQALPSVNTAAATVDAARRDNNAACNAAPPIRVLHFST